MDRHLIYLQIFFLLAVIVNLFIKEQLFLKILLLLLVFLFFFKEIPAYTYNKAKYLYVGIGFCLILLLFILTEYILHIYFLVFFMCFIVLYIYFYKVWFNTTYGEVIKCENNKIYFKINDPFYKSKKEYSLNYNKKVPIGSTVIVELSRLFSSKKPISIKKIILKEKNLDINPKKQIKKSVGKKTVKKLKTKKTLKKKPTLKKT